MPDSRRGNPVADAVTRGLLVYAVELVVIGASAVLAFLLRFDLSIPPFYLPILGAATLVWVPIKIATFKLFGLDRRWARYASMSDLMRIAASSVVGSGVSFVLLLAFDTPVPRSIYAIELLLGILLTAGLRVTVRLLSDLAKPKAVGSQGISRTIVYGAGDAGAALVRDIEQHPATAYKVVGFVDDNPRKQGLILHGTPVLGRGSDLSWLVKDHQIALILIAVPSAPGAVMRRIFEQCIAADLPYKTIPGVAELIRGGGLAGQIRDVAVEDLLGRNPANLEHELISETLCGKVVLVTGAAGSIGSEICRQVAQFRPQVIVGFDIAETPLFFLQQEMARKFPDVEFRAEIGSIQNARRLRDLFSEIGPEVVYHAAAYKHVPMMEAHLFEAVENNIFGTLNVVEAARINFVREFVMISSDKAVRPTNIMGATKRVAELVVRSFQPVSGRYVSVRFGNVLGSNGSVVPIFKAQIASGGPVTVTDPDMRRYFMTIPEACQLVLQASTMGRGGEIFVLDMGEPIKIVDLARNLIRLSGLRPDHDIPIEFTGSRPGEKLCEELSMDGEGLVETHHEKIRVFSGHAPGEREMAHFLSEVRGACANRDSSGVTGRIRELVSDYAPYESSVAGQVQQRAGGR